MDKKVKIEKVVSRWSSTCVHLSDGSQLEGIVSAETKQINGVEMVTIKAYIYPETPVVWVNSLTKETVSLTSKQAEMFFRNRNPYEWKRDFNLEKKT
jgi:hypothetical protein